MNIGRIERVPVRELWPHEEYGFSVWLEENLDVLGDAIGIRLTALEREHGVGPFRVDLVAEAPSGDMVIIENQLESSNHDHLGKLVTYFANLQAKLAVWVVTSGRPEHVNAVNWLNESTPEDQAFFIVQLEAIRIGQSVPAPLFTVLAGPSAEVKAIGQEKKVLAGRHVLRLRFWTELLDRARAMGVLHHGNRSPTKDSWVSAGAGRAGLTWAYVIWKEDRAAVELYIDTGDAEVNENILDSLLGSREQIEEAFGASLNWQRLEDRRACRVRHEIACGGLSAPPEAWPRTHEEMIASMDRLVSALGPYVKRAAR